ncbi:PRTRC system ThiF family protein [Dysgonomonas termitidis]|uniref:PRTRC system ThiF family protein n=1 Tax=Dysgonomonas termitidis TaxID=1516126 RepID=A0ABV9L449_9BACT
MKKRYHYTDKYLLNPSHPVTVIMIGCGGTGCRVLTSLAMMDASLQALGHPGLYVTVYDGDIVETPNIGRQLFYECDLSLNKAVVLVSRINRTFGSAWNAVPEHFNKKTAGGANIYISCVDNVKARLEIGEILSKTGNGSYSPYQNPLYWMDYGNMQKTGQAVLGTLQNIEQPKSRKYENISQLPVISERFDLKKIKDKDSGPSCSQAQALSKQDLFINSSLATLGCHILWELLKEGRTDKAGLYLNLENLRANSIPV